MTGSRSRVRSKGRSGTNAGRTAWLSKVSSQVSPSGRAFATTSVPMAPRLPEALGEPGRDEARDRVGGAAGREGHDDADRTARPVALRPRRGQGERRAGQRERRAAGEMMA